MGKVVKHIPNFMEGFANTEWEVKNNEEILALDWVRNWLEKEEFSYLEVYRDGYGSVMIVAHMTGGSQYVLLHVRDETGLALGWLPEMAAGIGGSRSALELSGYRSPGKPSFPLRWRVVCINGPTATIDCSDGSMFTIGVQVKRHHELQALAERIVALANQHVQEQPVSV